VSQEPSAGVILFTGAPPARYTRVTRGPTRVATWCKAEPVSRRHLGHGDLAAALPADDHHLVANARVRHRGQVDPRVLEVGTADERDHSLAHEHAPVSVTVSPRPRAYWQSARSAWRPPRFVLTSGSTSYGQFAQPKRLKPSRRFQPAAGC
jgi:hypothetical protein